MTNEHERALHRAKNGSSDGNYQTIITGFMDKGIPEDEIIPRVNVFTYNAWKALGRQVNRGEKGIRVGTVVERDFTDKDTGEEKTARIKRATTVFHISQTSEIDGKSDNPKQQAYTSEPRKDTAPPEPKKPNFQRLIDLANGMEKEIESKIHSSISEQRPTPRRLRIAESMRREGERLRDVRDSLLTIAEAVQSDSLPCFMTGIASKKRVYEVLHHHNQTDEEARNWLKARLTGPTEEEIKQARIRKIERELIQYKIPGFFPTPPDVIERMLHLAQVREGMICLEPSAGKGDLAEAIKTEGAEVIECYEINSKLREILEFQGFNVVGDDFTEAQPRNVFDRVVMNPPFEKGQDVDHIMKAFDFLSDGGVLVSVVSEGPFFRNDRKSELFRQWLEDKFAHVEELPDGSFERSLISTGVRTRLIMIEK